MRSPLTRVRALTRRIGRAWVAEVRARARRRAIWPDTILYESFAGNGVLDNPEAIFRRILERPDLRRFRHIWVLGRGHRRVRAELRRIPGVRVVRYRSPAYHRALARAEILVNNATFPPEWGKRPGQLYLNTWHGTPLKHMGYDMPDGTLQSANVLRNLLSADLLVSQSPWMTRTMYLDAYRLDGILPGRILDVGYPRTDRQHVIDDEASALRARLGARTRKLVVYAPTWTGDDFGHPRDDAAEQVAVVRDLQDRLGDAYSVRLKAHQSVHALVRGHRAARDVLVDNDIPTNRILGVADHLITDFSSIFFDYLARDAPITFYVPPSSTYLVDRGTYFPNAELPGPVVSDIEMLARRVRDPRDPADSRRRDWAERFVPRDDGLAADRVIDALLAGPLPSPPATRARRSVLIYVGGMRSNGITSSALNLVAALDRDAWDVTVLLARPRGAQRGNQALIPPHVRQLIRLGGMNGTKWELLGLLGPSARHQHRPESADQAELWRQEWTRLVGGARFDTVVDFSGYSRFWAELLLHSDAGRRVIWLHNDMAAEVHRTGAGRRPIHRSLPAVLRGLARFDAIVSVSPRLSTLNRDHLSAAHSVDPTRFVAARNLVDVERIRASARQAIQGLPEFADDDVPLPSWLHELEDDRLFWFVTAGRISPEKNHLRLLAAFELARERHPDARLLIIGDGPLRSRVESEIDTRGLTGTAFVTGRMANPFPLMARGRCFVLSSDYEGQPMVLLEAATLGLPIIATDFASSLDALPPGRATIVPRSAEALGEAMSDQVSRPRAPTPFDSDRYNREVLNEVEAVLRGPGGSSRSAASSMPSPASASSAIATRRPATTTTPAATTTTTHIPASDRVDDQTEDAAPAPRRL